MAPTKAHGRIRKVKRSHACIRSVYENLCVELSKISREERFSLTFRALNDTPHSNPGICPATLVSAVYAKIKGAHDRGSLMQRVAMIREFPAILALMKAKQTLKDL